MRRARGALLRAVRHRRRTFVAGVVLSLAGGSLAGRDYAWENWATEALSFLLISTGLMLILASFGGRRPDWIDPDARA